MIFRALLPLRFGAKQLRPTRILGTCGHNRMRIEPRYAPVGLPAAYTRKQMNCRLAGSNVLPVDTESRHQLG